MFELERKAKVSMFNNVKIASYWKPLNILEVVHLSLNNQF